MKRFLPVLFLALFFLGLFTAARAKNFELDRAGVFYRIAPDGLVEAEENIAFNFVGSFSFAYRDIPKGEWGLGAVRVSEGGAPLDFELIDQGNSTRIKWFYSAQNEKKTFTIKYSLSKAVKAFDDVGEFYWKVWGSGWDAGLQELYGEIELPAAVSDPKDVYSWGHPEINGKIGLLENRKLVFQAFNIPKGQWVEIRLVFPRSLLDGTGNATPVNGEGLEKIIAEENFYAAVPKISFFLVIALVLAEAALFFMLWHFYGREPKVDIPSIYEREPPADYSPAIVSALINQWSKKPKLNHMVAELLHLCLVGKLKLSKIAKPKVLGIFGRDEYEIIIRDKSPEGLPKSEVLLLEKFTEAAEYKFEGLFFKKKVRDARPNTVSLTELQTFLRAEPQKSKQFALDWQDAAKEEAESLKFFAKQNGTKQFAVGTAGLALVSVIVGILLSTPILFFATIIIVIEAIALFFIFPNALPNRTEKGTEHYIKWMRLKKFLEDFSSLKTVPPEAVVLWEKYLVYAIPLGVAKKVQKAMDKAFEGYDGPIKATFLPREPMQAFQAQDSARQ